MRALMGGVLVRPGGKGQRRLKPGSMRAEGALRGRPAFPWNAGSRCNSLAVVHVQWEVGVVASAEQPGEGVPAAGPIRKIALEEHFTTPDLASRNVARPTPQRCAVRGHRAAAGGFRRPAAGYHGPGGAFRCVCCRSPRRACRPRRTRRPPSALRAGPMTRWPRRCAVSPSAMPALPTCRCRPPRWRPTSWSGACASSASRAPSSTGRPTASISMPTGFSRSWERVADLDVPVYPPSR